MLTHAKHSAQIYKLHGEAVTQYQLVEHLNRAFDTDFAYTPMSVEDHHKDRVVELGEFISTIISGIYEGIQEGKMDNPSYYIQAARRTHESWQSYFSKMANTAKSL